MDNKPKLGRRPEGVKTLNRNIHTIVTIEDFEKVDEHCRKNELSISKFFRLLIRKFFEKEVK
jgi:hypothetical protein